MATLETEGFNLKKVLKPIIGVLKLALGNTFTISKPTKHGWVSLVVESNRTSVVWEVEEDDEEETNIIER